MQCRSVVSAGGLFLEEIPASRLGFLAILDCLCRAAIDAGHALQAMLLDPCRPSIRHRDGVPRTDFFTLTASDAGSIDAEGFRAYGEGSKDRVDDGGF